MFIILIGGEPTLHHQLDRHFQQRHAEFLTVSDCEAALEEALSRPPQLFICCESLPRGDIRQMLQKIQNESSLRNIPLILVTMNDPATIQGEQFSESIAPLVNVSNDKELFWQRIKAALEQIRDGYTQRHRQMLSAEAEFLSNGRQLLDADLSYEWQNINSNEIRFKTMVESSPDWFWEFDQNANFTYVSPRIRDLLGYEPEEVAGQNAFDLMDPAEAERVHRHFDPIARKYLPFTHLENINQHRDGHEVVIESSGTPIFGEEGQFLGYRGIDRDITERKRSEESLRKSEQRLRDAQAVAQLGNYSYYFATEKWESSEILYEILGIPVNSPMTIAKWLELVHPDHRDIMKSYFEETVLRRQKPFNRSYKIIRPVDGQTRWVHGLGQLEVDADGTLLSMIGTLQDVTPEKLVEEKLIEALNEARVARKQLGALFATVADALIVTDVQQRIILINHAAEQLFHCNRDEVKQKLVSDIIREQPFNNHLRALLQGQDVGPDVEFALSIPGEKTSRVIHSRLAVVRNDQGQITESISLLRDITNEHEAARMKSEFISIAAHELRTPLTAVTGFAELLEQEGTYGGFTESQRQEYLEIILNKCEQLKVIVDDLLSLSRLEMGRAIDLDKQPCQLFSELRRIIISHGLEAAGHTYNIDFPDQDVSTYCDVNKLEQVMDNLLSNAAKYSADKAEISISGEQQGDQLLVRVTDRGIGMSPEQVEQVFDKFYRADMSQTSVGGLGLGMSISKSIIETHGGKIWVESEQGVGTTVAFTLPL